MKVLYCNADILTSHKKNKLIHDSEKQHPYHMIAICEVKPKNGAKVATQNTNLTNTKKSVTQTWKVPLDEAL